MVYELGRNGFPDGCQKGFRPFPPEDVNTVRGRGHRQIPQEMFSQLNVSLLVNPDSFPLFETRARSIVDDDLPEVLVGSLTT